MVLGAALSAEFYVIETKALTKVGKGFAGAYSSRPIFLSYSEQSKLSVVFSTKMPKLLAKEKNCVETLVTPSLVDLAVSGQKADHKF